MKKCLLRILKWRFAGILLFAQAMVLGDSRSFLAALLVLDQDQWRRLTASLELDPDDPVVCDSEQVRQILLERVARQMNSFPGYARIHAVHCQLEPWSVEEGLMTPTLKLKRDQVYQTLH